MTLSGLAAQNNNLFTCKVFSTLAAASFFVEIGILLLLLFVKNWFAYSCFQEKASSGPDDVQVSFFSLSYLSLRALLLVHIASQLNLPSFRTSMGQKSFSFLGASLGGHCHQKLGPKKTSMYFLPNARHFSIIEHFLFIVFA